MRVQWTLTVAVRHFIVHSTNCIGKHLTDARMTCGVGPRGQCVEPLDASLHRRYQILTKAASNTSVRPAFT